MIETNRFEPGKFAEIVRRFGSFVITTHVNPDGDALGSEIGLAEWLLSIGKRVRIINCSPTPDNYLFLDEPKSIVEQFDQAKHNTILTDAEAILVLDVNDPSRTRVISKFLALNDKFIAVIDHHLEPKDFAEEYYIDIDACSTGEMVQKIIKANQPEFGGSISSKAARALYVAIMTDTGSFKFPRTDSEIFRMCAELLDLGADPVEAYNEVYNAASPSRLLLMGECLNSLSYSFDNRFAMQTLTQVQLKKVGAKEEDVDGFVQMPFQVKSVAMSVFVLELKEGWKLSVRSKGDVSAAKLAQHFEGNGHFNAAGARIYKQWELEELKREVLKTAGPLLR